MWAIFLLFILQTAPSVDAQADAERLFALGVQLFEEGDAAGAIAAFEGAQATGWSSGMLEYNLGTSFNDLERFGPAILHFERASFLMPGNEAIARNLRIAREQAGIVSDSATPIGIAAERLSRVGGPRLWLTLGLGFYIVLVALVGYRFWTRRTDVWPKRAIAVLVPVTAVVLIVALSAWGSARTPAAIVLSDDAQLRASPSSEASSRATLQAGLRVSITEIRGGWQAVRLPGGVRGWLPSRAVERI